MSEAKFTDGPWISGMHDISDAEEYNVECDVDCGWSYIGTSKKCIAMAVTKSHLDAELDANTALITAAPDMYESIESDVIRLEFDLAQLGDGFANVAEEINAELNVKRKLLAKARGEK